MSCNNDCDQGRTCDCRYKIDYWNLRRTHMEFKEFVAGVIGLIFIGIASGLIGYLCGRFI